MNQCIVCEREIQKDVDHVMCYPCWSDDVDQTWPLQDKKFIKEIMYVGIAALAMTICVLLKGIYNVF